MMQNNSVSALHYLTLSRQYLILAKILAQQIVDAGNPHVVVAKPPLRSNDYDLLTRYSDHNIGVALLFNFYHGIELTIKGHILGLTNESARGHKLTALLTQLKSAGGSDSLLTALHHWLPPTNSSVMGGFLSANQLDIDEWYQALKYPSMINGTLVSHFELKYHGNASLHFWQSIVDSADSILRGSVEMSHAFGYGRPEVLRRVIPETLDAIKNTK